jgi:DNA helicase-2/ATP-dependent DNA helicase PcrA
VARYSAEAEAVLAGLDPEQQAAVTAPAGRVCILAGAGTGKTRAITHRIAFRVLTGEIQAKHVLAVTFTARAAGQLRSRLADLGVQSVSARTFHAAALRQLRYFADRLLAGRSLPEVVGKQGPAGRSGRGALGRTDRPYRGEGSCW